MMPVIIPTQKVIHRIRKTKVRQIHAERLKNKLIFDGLFYVDGGGTGGGLALLWKDMGIT